MKNVMVVSDEVEGRRILGVTGALQQGHFLLNSGLHSQEYFQCALLLQHSVLVEKIGAALAAKFHAPGIDAVIAPAVSGLAIGQEVARQLGKRFIFTEKEQDKFVLRRGFKIAQGERILVVDDVVTKGSRIQETFGIIGANGGNVVAVAIVVDRSDDQVDICVPAFALTKLEAEAFEPAKCPLCEWGLPLIKPGS